MNYASGTIVSGVTEIPLCFFNSSDDTITDVQFRVWYDKSAFAGAIPQVVSLNISSLKTSDSKPIPLKGS
jgi:hypothetical protein